MLRMRVDASGAKRKMGDIIQRSPAGRRAAVMAMTRVILVRVAATAPRDTNRYVRGWMEAGNKSGVGLFFVPGLNRSSRYEQIKSSLIDEVEWWDMIVKRNESKGRTDKWAGKARQRLARAREEYRRLFWAENGAVIGINTFGGVGGAKAKRALYKIYGGDGRVIQLDAGAAGGATVVHLHNKEPHASMVERNTGTMRKAYSAFKGSGLLQMKGAYLNKLLGGVAGSGGAGGMTTGLMRR